MYSISSKCVLYVVWDDGSCCFVVKQPPLLIIPDVTQVEMLMDEVTF